MSIKISIFTKPYGYKGTELAKMLAEKGIECERKSIYSDVQSLKEYGLDIVNVRAPKRGYYLKDRRFEMAEVRLLTDAVLAAKFISPKKTKSLVYKIGSLASEGQEEKLREQVYVNSSVKCNNEELYEVISTLHEAIEKRVQVQFDYSKRMLQKRYVRRMESKTFTVKKVDDGKYVTITEV